MNEGLSHRQLIEKCLAGDTLPRTPIALWRHFPVDDQSADGLFAATLAFQHQYDFDLVKVSPSSSFCIKDWGAQDEWVGSTEGSRRYTTHPIVRPNDWMNLKKLSPTSGQMGSQLSCLKQLVHEFTPHTPVLQTIFSPLSQAKNLIGRDQLSVHVRLYPEQLRAALRTITQTTIDFIQEAAKTGIDGIFYAIQFAQYGLLSEEEFQTFGISYDLQVLEAAQDLWFNMAHIHGDHIMFDLVSSYPVQSLNWHDRQYDPSLAKASSNYKGVLCGGLRQWETMAYGTPQQVSHEAADAINSTHGNRFILGTGCVMPVITPHGNIIAAIKAARGI
jgi:uroporphyrinogen decarboxylase